MRPRDWSALVGRRFAAWTVLGVEPRSKGEPARLSCRCDCGAVVVVDASNVANGVSKRCVACGAMAKSRPLTHGATVGGTTTPTWESWRGMNERCENPNHRGFKRYGGRGIRVAPRWRASFGAFLADMGERPSRSHSIDRFPNRDGNYEPGNCRWATMKEQNRNRSSSRMITIDGQTRCVEEWAEHLGVRAGMIHDRLGTGWPDRDAVMTPRGSRRPSAGDQPSRPGVSP